MTATILLSTKSRRRIIAAATMSIFFALPGILLPNEIDLPSKSKKQPVSSTWIGVVNGVEDGAHSIAPTKEGFSIAGIDDHTVIKDGEYIERRTAWLAAVTGTGKRLRVIKYEQQNDRLISNVVACVDGGMLVTEIVNYRVLEKYDTGKAINRVGDSLITRLDKNGAMVWSKTFTNNVIDYRRPSEVIKAAQCGDGGFIIGCMVTPPADADKEVKRGKINIELIRIDEKGKVLWNHCYKTKAYEFLRRITETPDGGFLIAGYTEKGDYKTISIAKADKGIPSWGDGLIKRIDKNGNIRWSRAIAAHETECLLSARESKGNIVAIGYSQSNGEEHNGFIVTLTKSGSLVKAHIPIPSVYMNDFIIYPDGSSLHYLQEADPYFGTCLVDSPDRYPPGERIKCSPYLKKFNPIGTITSSIRPEFADAMFLCGDGGLIMTRRFNGSLLIMKTDKQGVIAKSALDSFNKNNLPDQEGTTPLSRAISSSDINAVAKLLDTGVCIDSGLAEAVMEGDIGMIKLLIDHGAPINRNSGAAIISASKYGRVDIVSLLIEKGASLDVRGSMFNTPLSESLREGHLNVAKLLIENGAPVDDASNGETALITASRKGYTDIAALLIKKGADIDKPANGTKSSALWCAAGQGHIDIVKLLIEHGASINNTNDYYTTPLMHSLSRGRVEIAKLLVEKGALIDEYDNYGTTALMIAAKKGFADITKLLIDKGARLDKKDKKNNSALDYAKKMGHKDIVTLLEQAGVKGALEKTEEP